MTATRGARGISAPPAKSGRRLWPALAKDGLAILLLLLATIAFYWRLLTPSAANRATFPLRGDFVDQFYAFARYRAQELWAGRLPLWNPYTYAGHPFIADVQSAVFYPLSWVTTFLAGPSYPLLALELEAIAHIFLAGALTYAFARVQFEENQAPPSGTAGRLSGPGSDRKPQGAPDFALGNRFAALLSALVFSFGGYLTSYPTQQLAILETEVWLPAILLCVLLATRPAASGWSRLAATVGGGLLLGISVLAGHPQSASFVLYGVGLYLLFRLYEVYRSAGLSAARRLLWIPFLLAAFAAGLAAVQWLPTLEFMRLSTRASMSYDTASGGFSPQDILQILLPGSVNPVSPMYIGVLPLVLAVLAVRGRQSREVLFWAFLAGAALLVSFGGHTFVYSILYHAAPGFGLFRDQERAVFLASFAAAQLAGYGALALAGQVRPGGARRTAVVLLVIAGAVGFLLALADLWNASSGKLGSQLNILAFALLMLLLCSALFAACSLGVQGRTLQAAAIALVVLDLFTVNWQNNLQLPQANSAPDPLSALTQPLQERQGQGRVYNEFRLPLNYGCAVGVEDINGASPLMLATFDQLRTRLPKERLWQLLNVRYWVTWNPKYQAAGSRLLAATKDSYLYELPAPLPRAAVLYGARVELTDDAALDLLASSQVDLSRLVVLAEDPGLALPQYGGAPTPATYTMVNPERLEIDVENPQPGILLVSDLYYPGWQARVDGRPAPILRADVALRAVALPAGKHHIEMAFVPGSLRVGAAISLATLALALALAIGARIAGHGAKAL